MKLFPTTIAVAEAFCNRVAERQLLKQYIKHGRHTVVNARQAIKVLLQKDFIYRDGDRFIQILDPAFKSFIQKLLA